MSLSQEDTHKLELIIQGSIERPSELSEWEASFIQDQIERYEQYGADIRLSEKQWAVLDRVYDKVV